MGFICYAPLQYQHCYIDLSTSFDDYQRKFSSKTRSTIKRKINKYADHCGGKLSWRTYRKPQEIREFHRLARAVSRLTYQERLLDAGIPDSREFVGQAESLAAADQVRAYVLFDGDRPVSYLYCPVQDQILIYAYLGYDPEYMRLSVGTILQWLALEALFNEHQFRFFDFTEGQSEHKRLFATHQCDCANVFLLKPSTRAKAIVRSQEMMNRISARVGSGLDRLGARAKVRRILRFAR
jgi:CelD/BcsL family acetyltransferase involved in cellulose biosynthesis